MKKNKVNNKIMFVDDDIDIVRTFRMGLANYGFKVDGFHNPSEALAKYKISNESEYDLLLIDIDMKDMMNGFELYQQIKKLGKKIPPVCFITAFQDLYDILKPSFPDISMNCFIRKPIELIDLSNRLKQKINDSF